MGCRAWVLNDQLIMLLLLLDTDVAAKIVFSDTLSKSKIVTRNISAENLSIATLAMTFLPKK
ncbi:MAG: hypothetical protein ACI9FR_000767 [Cryomorphaceae bacterium]|jgi:hypothetical protein